MRAKPLLPVLIATAFLPACAPQQVADENVAIDDFIVVSELEPLKVARLRHQYSYKQITENYVVLTSRDDYYLVEFRRRCRELNMRPITPDIRSDRNTLRPGIDTIRGCIIKKLFAIDESQARELEHIGKGP